MTHEEVMEQVDKKLIHILDVWVAMKHRDRCQLKWRRYVLDQIYAIPELLIKDSDQSLPKLKALTGKASIEEKAAFLQGVKADQEQMLKENWAKFLPKEEKNA